VSDSLPDEARPNVVIEGECAEGTEYAGMNISVNLKERRIWTGFDLIISETAEEFLDNLLWLFSYAAPALTLKEAEGTEWTDPDIAWGQMHDHLRGE
jgi:hypothetical protein